MTTLMHTQVGTYENDVLGSKIPVLVDFYADWCSRCKAVAPVLEKLAEQYDGRIRFVKVNVDVNQDLTSDLGIVSLPTLILYKAGEIVGSVAGAASKDQLSQAFDKVLN